LAVLAILTLVGAGPRVCGQGTAFTYQGQLNAGGGPANGLYDLRFSVYTVPSGGTLAAGFLTNSATPVSNGLFTVVLDFGTGVFDGTTYWLQIGVRTNGSGGFSGLSPRQELTPAPYAIFAESANAAGLSGTLPSSSLGGAYGGVVSFTNPGDSFTGDGTGLLNVNAVTLGGQAASNFWNTAGNAGTTPAVNFLGTTDNQPLQLRAFNEPGLQLRYASHGNILSGFSTGMNLIGGYWGNVISNGVVGATIAGGGGEFLSLSGSSALPNVVSADFGVVGGGYGNLAGFASAVPGGTGNTVPGFGSFAAGQYAQTAHNGTFIWGDGSQDPFNGADFDNGFNVLASSGVFFFNGAQGVHVDYQNQNPGGTIQYGLRFGAGGSGEVIASQRTAGGNQYGLDFYTSGNNRMTIANGGFVGINTTSPSQRLEVNGNYILIDGAGAGNGNGPIDAYIGGNGSGSDVQIGSMNSLITSVGFWNTAAGAWMHIACSSITINGGADVAEPFPITAADSEIPPGAVVVIDDEHPGHLKLSEQAYDPHVAGVVSGANGINPGIQMQQQGLLDGGKNVALTGRVYVQADARQGAIRPGDLLTTSSARGYAMKVSDHAKAQGAILGKAMTGLEEGKGMVLVLVTLQ
jgi:hypothetical protein